MLKSVVEVGGGEVNEHWKRGGLFRQFEQDRRLPIGPFPRLLRTSIRGCMHPEYFWADDATKFSPSAAAPAVGELIPVVEDP